MNKYSINPTELTKAISLKTGITQKEVRLILHAMEDITKQQLACSNSSRDIEIKFFPGLTLVSEYVCAYEARNPLTGGQIPPGPRRKIHARVSRNLKESVNVGGVRNVID